MSSSIVPRGVCVLCVLALGLVGCRQVAEEKGASAPAVREQPPAERGQPLTGRVVSVLTERGTLLVDHDEIPGYMPRMTMEFAVGAGDLALAREGAELRARLIEEGEGRFRLENIWWGDAGARGAVAQAASRLREETGIRGRAVYREVGENLPDFALYTQRGEVAQAAQWRGKQIMLNFIYTRCPIATMCPMATAKMVETQKLAREAGVVNLELVSITLDPEYDTPGVLREYAEARGIDTSNFSFLTGPEGAIKDLLKQFGVLAELDGDSDMAVPIIKHTLTTVLINEEGRIAWRADGSQWAPEDFVAKMKR
jgi:protein SCO1/2